MSLEPELGECSTDLREVAADEGDVVCGNPGRHMSQDPRLDEAVGESRGNQRERESCVLVSANVGRKQRCRQVGIGVEAVMERAGHLSRISGHRDILAEKRLPFIARVIAHTRGEEAGRMREPCEDRRRESIGRKLMGIECRLGGGGRRQKQAKPRNGDHEGSASGLQKARPMTAGCHALDRESLGHSAHSGVERNLPARRGTTGAAPRFARRRPATRLHAETDFPPGCLYPLANDTPIGRMVR